MEKQHATQPPSEQNKWAQQPTKTIFAEKIVTFPKLKRRPKAEQRQQILPGLQEGRQLALL